MTRFYSIIILTMLPLLSISSSLLAGESCSMLSGTCRNACSQGEQAASGAFDDCGEKQECCLAHDISRDRINCCIASFDSAKFGPFNCTLPINDICLNGSGSPVQCEKLGMCKEKDTR